MEYRYLGRTGMKVSELGLPCPYDFITRTAGAPR